MWEEHKRDNTRAGNQGAALGTAHIGKGTLIKGRVESRQDLYLDGEIQGTLIVLEHRLTIGPNGRIGDAQAREVDVLGVVIGDIESAEKVSVRKGGRLVGDIRTAGIVIEDGAYFKGSIDIVSRRVAAPQPAPAPPATTPPAAAPEAELEPAAR